MSAPRIREYPAHSRRLFSPAGSPMTLASWGAFRRWSAENPQSVVPSAYMPSNAAKEQPSHLWIVNVHGTFFQSTKGEKIDNN